MGLSEVSLRLLGQSPAGFAKQFHKAKVGLEGDASIRSCYSVEEGKKRLPNWQR